MWHNFKMVFADGLGLTDVQLHLGAGIILFLVALGVGRRVWFAFGTVTVLQAVNELIDLFESIAANRPISVERILLDSAWTLSGALLLAIFAGIVAHARLGDPVPTSVMLIPNRSDPNVELLSNHGMTFLVSTHSGALVVALATKIIRELSHSR